MMHGEWRKPNESINDYCCRVDDEIRPHERRDYRFITGVALTWLLIIIMGFSAWIS